MDNRCKARNCIWNNQSNPEGCDTGATVYIDEDGKCSGFETKEE